MSSYQEFLKAHYCNIWQSVPVERKLGKGPMNQLSPDFCVLEFAPFTGRDMWTYATSGMSLLLTHETMELHIFSSAQDSSLVELLTVIAHYHATGKQLHLDDTVNFGRPWQRDSHCTYGLLSLPYLDGPKLQNIPYYSTECYWLIPITEQERNFKVKFGLEKLEDEFELMGIDYINPNRASIV